MNLLHGHPGFLVKPSTTGFNPIKAEKEQKGTRGPLTPHLK